MRSLQRRQRLAAVGFLAATIVLAVQLINPSPVVVSAGGDVTELTGFFTYRDAAVIAASGTVLGASATYLLVGETASDSTAADSAAGDSVADDSVASAAATDATATDAGSQPSNASAEAVANSAEPAGSPSTAASTDAAAGSEDLLEARRREWEETAERLANKERTVYETLLEADGTLPQSEIVEETDLSKASVSRALDGLEAKDLVERKRRGLGNVVLLL